MQWSGGLIEWLLLAYSMKILWATVPYSLELRVEIFRDLACRCNCHYNCRCNCRCNFSCYCYNCDYNCRFRRCNFRCYPIMYVLNFFELKEHKSVTKHFLFFLFFFALLQFYYFFPAGSEKLCSLRNTVVVPDILAISMSKWKQWIEF